MVSTFNRAVNTDLYCFTPWRVGGALQSVCQGFEVRKDVQVVTVTPVSFFNYLSPPERRIAKANFQIPSTLPCPIGKYVPFLFRMKCNQTDV